MVAPGATRLVMEEIHALPPPTASRIDVAEYRGQHRHGMFLFATDADQSRLAVTLRRPGRPLPPLASAEMRRPIARLASVSGERSAT